jgi:hypothetical protein
MNARPPQTGSEPFGRFPRRIFENPDLLAKLNKSDLAVVMQVGMLLSAGTWTAYITNQTLADRCGCDLSTVRRSVQRLIGLGILERPRKGRLAFNLSREGGTDAPTEGGTDASTQNHEGRTHAPMQNAEGCTDASMERGTHAPLGESHGGTDAPTWAHPRPLHGGTHAPHSRGVIKNSNQQASARLIPFKFTPDEARSLVARFGEQAVHDVIYSVDAHAHGELRNPAGWVRAAFDRVADGSFELDLRVRAGRRAERSDDWVEFQRERRAAEAEAERERANRDGEAMRASVAALCDERFDRAAARLEAALRGTTAGEAVAKAIREGRARESRVVLTAIGEFIEQEVTA